MSLERLRELAELGYLYAIVDACGAPAVPPKMQELGETETLSLFKGTPKEDYWAVAPYLLRVSIGTLCWLQENLWNDPWGIFLFSKASFEELHQHFRALLVVQKPDGQYWLFRYYDPRVLETFLGTCASEETERILGPARACGITVKDSTQCTIFLGKESGPLTHIFSIRPDHEEFLNQAAMINFEFRLFNHLNECFPQQCRVLGAKGVREVMIYGIRWAQYYGIRGEGEICQYLNALFTLGPGFDNHPALSSVKQILNDRQQMSSAKIAHLSSSVVAVFGSLSRASTT